MILSRHCASVDNTIVHHFIAMVTFINTLLDRCLFTVFFVLGVQLPEFITQYSQQLSGHLSEAKLQLVQFQQLADLQHNGNLVKLINSFKANQDITVVETAKIIEQLIIRVNYLEQHLVDMLSPSYWLQIKTLLLEHDLAIVQQTATLFKLAIPLEINALATGVILALFIITLKALITLLIRRSFTKRQFIPSELNI